MFDFRGAMIQVAATADVRTPGFVDSLVKMRPAWYQKTNNSIDNAKTMAFDRASESFVNAWNRLQQLPS